MNSPHPSDRTLQAYGLGKLDDESEGQIIEHLERCLDCQQRVAGFTSDSFLGRFREVHQPSNRSILGGSMVDGTMSFMQAKVATAPPPADTILPGLADHPDYEIKRELGRGGMGVVYLAHNTMMGRDEVLKVMARQIMERPGVLERFQREIRAVAKLRHPNIVAAYHAFRIEGGLVFSMEYVEGLDLARLVKAKGPLSVAHAAYFVQQAAIGLQHAHEKGLIHRDIKPHNLMLTHDGKARLIKVLDFGLAKATREQKVESGLTSEGQALGTPDYIAPEQIVNALDVDIRADIYSLGGTLFFLLTGRPPFQANSLYDLYQAHMSRDADPLNLIRPEVPAELAALVAKLMAKDPKRRFQTPAEVAQALTPFFKLKLASVQAETSQAGPIKPKPLRSIDQPSPTELAEKIARPTSRRKTTAEPPVTKRESLIDFRGPGSESIEEKPLLTTQTRRPRWVWPTLSAGLLLSCLFIAWLAGVFKVNTPDGVIVLENLPKDADVMVDGVKVKITWPGEDKPLELRAVPGEHKLEVIKNGFKTFGESVTFKRDGSEEIRVRLEPLPVARAGDGRKPIPPNVADLLQVGSVWADEPSQRTFTILERQGERFKARFQVGPIVRELTGTIKNGLIRWRKEDVEVIVGEGSAGNHGEIRGKELHMSWTTPEDQIIGWYVLSLKSPGPGGSAEKVSRTLAKAEIDPNSETVPGTLRSPIALASTTLPRAKIGTGAWTIEGNELVQLNDQDDAFMSFGDPEWSEYDLTLEALRVKNSGPGHGLIIAFHSLPSRGFAWFGLGVYNNNGCEMYFSKDGQGSRASDNSADNYASRPLKAGDWHSVKMEIRKSQFKCYLDGDLLFEGSKSSLTQGRLGLRTGKVQGRFRNIKVVAPDGKILMEGLPKLTPEFKTPLPDRASKAPAIPLFNGQDLTGWTDLLRNNSNWSVVDGILEGRGSLQETGPRGPGVLVLNRNDLKDYRFRAKLRHRAEGFGWIEIRRSYNANLVNGYAVSTGTWPKGLAIIPIGSIQELTDYRYTTPRESWFGAEPNSVAVDEWCELTIDVRGNRVVTSLNGKMVGEYTDPDGADSSGSIALCCVWNTIVQYQSITLEELAPDRVGDSKRAENKVPGTNETADKADRDKATGVASEPEMRPEVRKDTSPEGVFKSLGLQKPEGEWWVMAMEAEVFKIYQRDVWPALVALKQAFEALTASLQVESELMQALETRDGQWIERCREQLRSLKPRAGLVGDYQEKWAKFHKASEALEPLVGKVEEQYRALAKDSGFDRACLEIRERTKSYPEIYPSKKFADMKNVVIKARRAYSPEANGIRPKD